MCWPHQIFVIVKFDVEFHNFLKKKTYFQNPILNLVFCISSWRPSLFFDRYS
ncbi:hypothetical protein O3M35_002009 [Rhynocoris fuscipes]|uniref:Uncharacterized protein n=1 Tax=Rhynocoris fuscipes TaxID=488301 RepID=A0AAW1CT65_9HEMI